MLPRIAPWLWGSVTVSLHKAERGNSNREGWSRQHPFSSSWESLKASLACTSALSFAILLRGGMETSHKKKKKKGSAGKQFEAVFALFHSQQSPNGLGSFSLAYSFLLWHLIKGPKKILVHCSNNREGLTRLAPVMPENPTKSTDLSFTPPCFTRGLQRPQCRLVHAWAAIPNHCKTFYECNFSLIHIS